MKTGFYSLVLISLLALVEASADERWSVPVLESEMDTSDASVSGRKFGLEPELGRAWVEVEVREPGTGEESGSTRTLRAKVDGLRYDPVTRTIVFEREEGSGKRSIPCVRVEARKRLWVRYEKQVPTGKCLIQARILEKKVDTGFELRTREVLEVSLEVSSGS
jgi:hypothetical protein